MKYMYAVQIVEGGNDYVNFVTNDEQKAMDWVFKHNRLVEDIRSRLRMGKVGYLSEHVMYYNPWAFCRKVEIR